MIKLDANRSATTLLFMTIMHISNNSPLFGQSESMSEEMAADEAGGEEEEE